VSAADYISHYESNLATTKAGSKARKANKPAKGKAAKSRK
jgi:hypothetical protein